MTTSVYFEVLKWVLITALIGVIIWHYYTK